MKIRILAIVGAMLLLSACSAQETVQPTEAPAETTAEAVTEITEAPAAETEAASEDAFTVPEDHNHLDENTTYLLPDEAEDIALAHAGFTSKQVSKLRNRFNAKQEATYDVSFIADGREYDYTVHAVTGQIVEIDIDGTASTDVITDKKLSREQAQTIALEHAGFTADQVMYLYVTFDLDDGVPEYEVEFVANDMEYEYVLHAESGEILEFDMDK